MATVHRGEHEFLDRVSGRYLDHRNKVVSFDDFLGDTLNTDFYTIPTKGSDGQTVDFAILSGEVGGAIRGTTGDDAAASYAVNGIQLGGALQWKANQGNLEFQARVKISAITDISIFVGFSDQVANLEEAASLSGTTFTTNATDAVGFLFDTAATTDTIRAVGVKADTDGTHVDTSLAFVADTYRVLGIRIDATGNATFLINDATVAYVANAVTATVALAPYIGVCARAAASRTCTVDWVLVQGNRA
jgi:hypothetical protein